MIAEWCIPRGMHPTERSSLLAYVERRPWAMENKVIIKTMKVLVAGDDRAF
jgi:hypothetical protein